LYSKMIRGIEIPVIPLQDPHIQQKLDKLDTKKWELSK
jgi:hypothetical protein